MNTTIRRMIIGFNKDKDDRSLTISLYLNLLTMLIRRSIKNLVLLGIITSVLYWLGFLVLSLSPATNIVNSIWLVYTAEHRIFAAYFALVIVASGISLYCQRIYQIGKFVEQREGDDELPMSEINYKHYAKILDVQEDILREREQLMDDVYNDK